jgi:hypothetical protein
MVLGLDITGWTAILALATVLLASGTVWLAVTDRRRDDRKRQQDRKRDDRLRAEALQGQNLFAIIMYLEKPEHLQARATVNTLQGKPLKRWSAKERQAANIVWRLWTTASIFQKRKLIPRRYLHMHYGDTILLHWETLREYIDDLRAGTYHKGRAREFEQVAKEIKDLEWYRDGKDLRPPYPSDS